jgi:hypothetical protein
VKLTTRWGPSGPQRVTRLNAEYFDHLQVNPQAATLDIINFFQLDLREHKLIDLHEILAIIICLLAEFRIGKWYVPWCSLEQTLLTRRSIGILLRV